MRFFFKTFPTKRNVEPPWDSCLAFWLCWSTFLFNWWFQSTGSFSQFPSFNPFIISFNNFSWFIYIFVRLILLSFDSTTSLDSYKFLSLLIMGLTTPILCFFQILYLFFASSDFFCVGQQCFFIELMRRCRASM